MTETTWVSEFGAELPARVYSAERGPSRFTVTVADYSHAERILTERAGDCPPGAERCSGGGSTGEGYWRHDVRGALLYATWTFLQRDAEATHLGYNSLDRVEGHQLHLTNPDQSRTFVSIYMHEDKLYVAEGTVPRGYPEPALFQQSLGWLDENGNGLRYESRLLERVPGAAPRPGRVLVPGEGTPRCTAPGGRQRTAEGARGQKNARA